MQFKQQKHKIQVLAYRGYDNIKRRAIVKMLGSLDAYSFEPSDDLLDKLTNEEKDELKAYIETTKRSKEREQLLEKMQGLPADIADIAKAITAGDIKPTKQWAKKLWGGVNGLSKALRKAGFPKSRYSTAKPPQSLKNERKQDQQGVTMDDTKKVPMRRFKRGLKRN